MPKCCLFQWIFSLAGRLYLWRKTFCLSRCDFCRLFHTERSCYAFSEVIVVSGRHDLSFNARAFPLTSLQMQCFSLRLNKGFRLFNFHCLQGSPKSELRERWPKKFRKKLCYFRLLPNLAHRKLIDLANHLPSSSPVSYTHLTLPTKRIV